MNDIIKTISRVSGLSGITAYLIDAIRIIHNSIGARHMHNRMCCCYA